MRALIDVVKALKQGIAGFQVDELLVNPGKLLWPGVLVDPIVVVDASLSTPAKVQG